MKGEFIETGDGYIARSRIVRIEMMADRSARVYYQDADNEQCITSMRGRDAYNVVLDTEQTLPNNNPNLRILLARADAGEMYWDWDVLIGFSYVGGFVDPIGISGGVYSRPPVEALAIVDEPNDWVHDVTEGSGPYTVAKFKAMVEEEVKTRKADEAEKSRKEHQS